VTRAAADPPATPDPLELPGNGHRASYRVRFDEATPGGTARTSALLRYAQDVAWAHSDALGFDRAWYRERGLAWLVRAAEVEVLAGIPLGATLDVGTAVVGYRRIWARRHGEFRLDGALVAAINTDWLLVDGRGRISRIPEVFGTTFPAPPGDIELGRVTLPEAPPTALVRTFSVRPHELDPMDHVNNAVYLDWLEESVLAAGGRVDGVPRHYRIEYAAAAEPGAGLESRAWQDADGWAYLVRGDGGDVFRGRVDA
jgi:acyl-CoA thioester hydrolase